jgi:hypothetical protein
MSPLPLLRKSELVQGQVARDGSGGDCMRPRANPRGRTPHFLLASVLQDAMIIESRTLNSRHQKSLCFRSGCN